MNDGSLGSRIIFEIQSFYPFPKTFQKLSTLFFPPVTPHKRVKDTTSTPGSIPDQVQLPKYSENHVNQQPIARHYPALDMSPVSPVLSRHSTHPAAAGPSQRHGTGTLHTSHSHRDHSAPSVVARSNENYGPGSGIMKKNASVLEDRKSSSSTSGRSDPRI